MDKKSPVKKFFWFLAVNVFWLVIFLIILDVLAGFIIFYKYASSQNSAQNTSAPATVFQEELYQKIIGHWQEK